MGSGRTEESCCSRYHSPDLTRRSVQTCRLCHQCRASPPYTSTHLPSDEPRAQDSTNGSRDSTSLILIVVPIAFTLSYELLQRKV